MGRLENWEVSNRQGYTVIAYLHHVQYLRIKPDVGVSAKEGFLEKIFLRLEFIFFLFFPGLIYLFHKIALAVTVQPGFIPVYAKVRSDVTPV